MSPCICWKTSTTTAWTTSRRASAVFISDTGSGPMNRPTNRPQWALSAQVAKRDRVGSQVVDNELKRSGIGCEAAVFCADEDVLLKRYSETRRSAPAKSRRRGPDRRHPSGTRGRWNPSPMRPICDRHHPDERARPARAIRQRVAGRSEGRTSILFESFAYRHGVPDDADFVFDVRSLPNPNWKPRRSNDWPRYSGGGIHGTSCPRGQNVR